jgi:hypothetical protein
MKKLTYILPKPMPAANDCLPHAAMNLGAPRGVGTRPVAGMVSQLIIEEQHHNFVLYRLDDRGGFVGDTWHGTLEDALHQAKREFGADLRPLISNEEDDLARQLSARDRMIQRHRAAQSPAERLAAMMRLQAASRELLRRSPEGYAHFLRRNFKARSVGARSADGA